VIQSTTGNSLYLVHRKVESDRRRPLRACLQEAKRRCILNARLVSRAVSGKHLFCRPQGGWNDILVQISICFDYALRFQRHLIVDTCRSGLLDELSKYFRPILGARGISFSVPAGFAEKSKRMSCFPACLTGRGIGYASRFHENLNYIESTTGQQLAFDMSRDYYEDLLIYEQCGGGDKSKEFFEWTTLTPSARREIRRRIGALPAEYCALHVRHSDVKCRYIEFFQAVKGELNGRNVLICTDSVDALAAAQEILTESKTYSISNIPYTKGVSLHHSPGITDWNVNVGALSDLAAMSKASELFRPSLALGYESGFVMLAANLMQTKALMSC
jgi:hypothetical protein